MFVFSDKRRIADDVVAVLRRQNRCPVGSECVGAGDVRDVVQRNGGACFAEAAFGFAVHLVVGDIQRGFGDFAGVFFNLYAEKLVDADFLVSGDCTQSIAQIGFVEFGD